MRRIVPLLTALSLLVPAAAMAQDFDAEGEQAMLDRVNALRAEHELSPVERLPELDAVARGHSAEMARTGQLAHVSDASGTPEDRVRRAGVEAGAIAENVAFHHDTANAQQALIDSPAHRGNMLSADATHVGLASVRTEGGVYVTQVFAELAPAAPVIAEASPPAPVEAAADEEPPAAPSFGLIPPFVERSVERSVEQSVEQVAGAAEAVTGPASQDAAPADAEPAREEAPAAEPQGAAEVSPIIEAPGDAPAAEDAPSTVSRGEALTLRRLLGMAQSLLGAAPAE